MNRCIYCNKRLGTADTNSVCSECANERKGTYATTQPIILSRVYFSETPPTADEVCKALSEYYGEKVIFEENAFWYITIIYNNEQWVREVSLKDLSKDNRGDLITLIGRFYEN